MSIEAAAFETRKLKRVERRLADSIRRGEVLDLAGDEPVDQATMRAWDDTRTVRSSVVRDILRARLISDPDPHGLRLRGARIVGRVDLKNLSSTLSIELTDCLLEEGLDARNATLTSLVLDGSRLEHLSEPPLYADGLTTRQDMSLAETLIVGASEPGLVRLLGAHVGVLDCAGAECRNKSGPALAADGLEVDKGAFLSGKFVGAGAGGTVRLLGAHIGALDCDGAEFCNKSGPALHADGLQVDLDVFLRNGFSATGTGARGAVRLLGTHIGGQLACNGAQIRNESGPALQADGLQVDQGVFLSPGFTATGAGAAGTVRLVGAHVGALDCGGATLHNESGPGLHADSLQVDQDVVLPAATGAFTAAGVTGDLNLRGVRIGGRLKLDSARPSTSAPTPVRLAMDGLTYTGLPLGISTGEWLRLLRDATPAYAAQPYQQLAAGHRAAGDDGAARRVLMAQRRDQIERRALTGRTERMWARFLGVMLGYGYQSWRALLALLAVVAVAVSLTVTLGQHGALARKPAMVMACSTIEQVGVGLDLSLPLIKTGARDRCDTTTSTTGQVLTLTSWILQLLAWAFAALFIAGFTSAVRKP